MAQLGKAALTTVVGNTIYTNTIRAIKGNTSRDRYFDIIDSSLNTLDDLNVINGYLGIDAGGIVDVSFIKKMTPTGQFLKDDGTWETVSTDTPFLQDVVDADPTIDGVLAQSLNGLNSINLSDTEFSAAVDAHGGFYATNGLLGSVNRFQVANTLNLMYHTVQNVFEAPLHSFTGDVEIGTGNYIYGGTGEIDFYAGTGIALTSDNSAYATPYVWVDNTTGLAARPTVGLYEDSFNSKRIQLVQGSAIDVLFLPGLFRGLRVFDDCTAIGSTTKIYQIAPVTEFTDGGIEFVSGIGIDTTATGGSDVLNIGATNANVINYGNSSTIHNFLGTAIYELQVNAYVTDKLVTYNYGGAAASGIGVGFEINENAVITGYFKTNASRDGFSILTPAIAYYSELKLDQLTANRTHSLPNGSGILALESFVDSKVTDAIADGVTTVAPSQNAVYDALALKLDKTVSVLGSYLEVPEQSAPGTPTNAIRLFSDTSNRFSWIGENGFVRTFDGTGNTADRIYVLPDSAGTVALGTGTANELAYWSAANTLGTLAVATYPSLTEISYIKGLTSAIQTQLNAKLPIAAGSTTGVALTFVTDQVYGTIGSPETGNITFSTTGAQIGVTNLIIHNNGTAPTFASNMKILSGSGSYVISVVNYIFVTYVNSTEVIYSINQRT